MISPVAFSLLGVLCAAPANPTKVPEGGRPALVIVALPGDDRRADNPAILEALNRLRGEATSVGFEVRSLNTGMRSASDEQLKELSQGLRPVAVVALGASALGVEAARSLDVRFLDAATGETAVAHLVADASSGVPDRSDVVLAVRAVDFIRAHMEGALARRKVEALPPKARAKTPSFRRLHLAFGVGVLGTRSGFSPALAPEIEVGYALRAWGRIGATAWGFGTRPTVDASAGRVSVDQYFAGLRATLLGRPGRRLHPELDAGGGEYWLVVRGTSSATGLGRRTVVHTLAGFASIGLALDLSASFALDLRAGTLWIQNEPRVYSTGDTYLGGFGRPSWFSSLRLDAGF